MKNLLTALALLITVGSYAQRTVDTVLIHHDTDTPRTGKKYSVSIGSKGLKISNKTKDTTGVYVERDDADNGDDSSGEKKEKVFEVHYGMLDLGFNRIHNRAASGSVAGTSPLELDGSVLSLREGKSINVNIWPIATKFRLYNGQVQRWYLTSGVGLHLLNFRFNSPYNYTDQPTVGVRNFDSLNLVKNKLAFTYLAVPLMLQGKTRLSSNAQLVYGFGAMGAYRFSSWTKLKTKDGDKIKNYDDFNFRDFKVALTGEIGIDPYLRLYATYDLTRLHNDDGTGLDQHPWTIGVRIAGL